MFPQSSALSLEGLFSLNLSILLWACFVCQRKVKSHLKAWPDFSFIFLKFIFPHLNCPFKWGKINSCLDAQSSDEELFSIPSIPYTLELFNAVHCSPASPMSDTSLWKTCTHYMALFYLITFIPTKLEKHTYWRCYKLIQGRSPQC